MPETLAWDGPIFLIIFLSTIAAMQLFPEAGG